MKYEKLRFQVRVKMYFLKVGLYISVRRNGFLYEVPKCRVNFVTYIGGIYDLYRDIESNGFEKYVSVFSDRGRKNHNSNQRNEFLVVILALGI